MDAVLHVHRGDAGLEVLLDLLLVARLGVEHEPLAGTIERRDVALFVVVLTGVEQGVLIEDLDIGTAGLGLGSARHRFAAGPLVGEAGADGRGVGGGLGVGRLVGGLGFDGGVVSHETQLLSKSSRMKVENNQSSP